MQRNETVGKTWQGVTRKEQAGEKETKQTTLGKTRYETVANRPGRIR
jgi:hypothetical protein